MNSLLLRLRRTIKVIAVLLAVFVLAGATYQGVATALERHRFERPGGLVDAGGHQLHIHCTGKGSPIVILEAAAGSMSSAWAWVQPEVARITRVCSYDRAGLGWSEAGDGRYLPARVPEELRVLLDRANEIGPIVLVGHEAGALFARMYAAQFSSNTAALVLIDDPTVEPTPSGPTFVSAWPWLARIGVLRATRTLSRHASGFPGESGGATRAFLNRPDHLARGALEIRRLQETARDAAGLPLDPALPVTQVPGSGDEPPALLDSADRARDVSRAIEQTVKRVRR